MTPPPTVDGSCLPVSCFSPHTSSAPRLSTNTTHKGGSHLHERWLPFLEVSERPEGGETASYTVTPLHQEDALGKPVARSHSGSIPVCDGCFLKGEVSGWRLGGASVGRWHTTTIRFTPVLVPHSPALCSQVPHLGPVCGYTTGTGNFLLF